MKKKIQLLVVILCVFCSSIIHGQDVSQLKNIEISTLSDDQIASYWDAIQKKGYSLEQVEVLGKAQGISATKIDEFKTRVNSLSSIKAVESKILKVNDDDDESFNDSFGIKEGEMDDKDQKETLLFGYDFFNNSKVTFTPSVNLAVPDNYQIGPGDELMIDLWGASEITYKTTVNNNGSIKINGVGFIYVNGFSLEVASKKIIAKLKKKHAGIGASKDSYNKIETNVTVSKIRTVQVNIIGEVKVPGTYSLNSLSTVLNALYVAGGPTKLGTFREIKLVRKDETVATLDVYEYLLNGTQKGNLKLQDQDVLLVGPYKNLVTVEGAVKRPGIYELTQEQTLANLIDYFGGFTSKSYTSLFVVERLNGTQKEVKEVALSQADTFVMKSGDRLVIQEVLDTYENKISIEGAVYRPGNFEFNEGLSLKDLIEKAQGVTPEAFLSRGILVRTYDDTQKENIPFSVQAIINGATTIPLLARDDIRIFRKDELRENRTISVSGAVNTEQTIDFIDNLQIEDVIAMSGGLQEGADPEQISVSRRLKDGSFRTLSTVFSVSSAKNLEITSGEPFYLKPFDIVSVRYAKGYTAQKTVSVKGEVYYEGKYVLQDKNERISDLINRAGGLTIFAYLEGAYLSRKTIGNKEDIGATLENTSELGKEISKELTEQTTAKIGINLPLILKAPGSQIDLLLQEGDELIIPSEKQTVNVTGMVLSPSLVQFDSTRSLKDYINGSGGFSEKAKKSKTYVVYQNGDIKTTRTFLFFKWYPKLAPGATIFVPEKEENRKRLTVSEILGITTSLATLGVLVQTLTK